eukprot:9844088-Ditylum_brightwellii.AAC.1
MTIVNTLRRGSKVKDAEIGDEFDTSSIFFIISNVTVTPASTNIFEWEIHSKKILKGKSCNDVESKLDIVETLPEGCSRSNTSSGTSNIAEDLPVLSHQSCIQVVSKEHLHPP